MTDAPDEPVRLDWTQVEPDMARLILARADAFLAAQLTTANASDQRAIRLAGVLVTLGTAMFGVATTDWAVGPPALGAISAGAIFLVAAWRAFAACRPVDFYFNGAHPKEWWPVRLDKLAEVSGIETENIQEAIEHNERILSRNGRRTRWVGRLAVFAPIVGLISWSLALWFQEGSFQALWIAVCAG